jgi:hypothetical protein
MDSHNTMTTAAMRLISDAKTQWLFVATSTITIAERLEVDMEVVGMEAEAMDEEEVEVTEVGSMGTMNI